MTPCNKCQRNLTPKMMVLRVPARSLVWLSGEYYLVKDIALVKCVNCGSRNSVYI